MYGASITGAFFGWVVVITARARIHGSNQHEISRIVDTVAGPADGDFSVFQGLAQHFQYASFKFGEFVQK